MSIPQLDIKATKYLSKPNVETTKYFTQESYDIDELERKVNENTQNISDLDSRTSNIESRLAIDEADIDSLQSTVASIASTVSNHETRLNTDEAEIASIATRITSLQSTVNNHETRITSLE